MKNDSLWKPDNGLSIPRGIYYRILKNIQILAPEEACGLLVGSKGRVRRHLPIENIHHSQSRYRMEPRQQLKAILWMEDHYLDLLAIYHSHPQGPDELSETDIMEITFPETIYVVFFPDCNHWKAKGFLTRHCIPKEIPLKII